MSVKADRPRYALFAALLMFSLHVPAWGQIAAERFYPPAATAGTETTIQIDGKLPEWPVQFVSNRQDVLLAAGEESGQMRVVVEDGAPPGVAWIRLHDDHSASSLLPLLITRAAVRSEQEPNDKLGETVEISLPGVVCGRLEKRNDVDGFRVAVQRGEQLVVSATAHRVLASPMDAVLQLVDTKGNVLAQSDDARGIDPQLVYTAPHDGELIIRIFAFPETPTSTIGFSGSASFVYSIAVTVGPFLDHALPFVLPSDAAELSRPSGWNLSDDVTLLQQQGELTASRVSYVDGALGWQSQMQLASSTSVVFDSAAPQDPAETQQLPVIFSGHISQPQETDRLRFPVEKGKKYSAQVHARHFGLLLDSVLRIVDPESDKEIARNDDRSRRQYDAGIEFTAPADGRLELQIEELSGIAGPRRAYSVELREATPTVRLAVAADHFVVESGKAATVAVSVERMEGFDKPLRVAAVGLPEGVQAEPVISAPKGDSSKSVELAITADDAAAFNGPFRIVATELGDDEEPTERQFPATFGLREDCDIREFWLSVAKPSAK